MVLTQKSRFVAGSLLLALLVACSDSPLDVTQPDFRGTVELVTLQPDDAHVRAQVLLTDIGPAPGVASMGDPAAELFLKKLLLIRSSTQIVLRQPDGSHRVGALSDIREGGVLSIKHTGVEMRSLPPRYEAVWVEVSPVEAN